jgi:nicotinate-nucleotide pyrophosphorylase (carboxylating)
VADFDRPLPDEDLRALVRRALDEDVGTGDVTSEATVPQDARARAVVAQKTVGVVYGLAVAEATFLELDPEARFEALTEEGEWQDPGDVFAVEGRARALLAAERTALNFLARLSGVATLTAKCVAAVEPHDAVVLDTRKTTPGLRTLEKAAVRAGGAQNHRVGLYDAILIKENHIAMAGGLGEAVRRAREASPDLLLEVEARTRDEVEEALEAGAPRILLDNMSPAELIEMVELVDGRAELECSGGMTLDSIRDHAATGVQFVSVGALTHSAPALDLSLRLEPL